MARAITQDRPYENRKSKDPISKSGMDAQGRQLEGVLFAEAAKGSIGTSTWELLGEDTSVAEIARFLNPLARNNHSGADMVTSPTQAAGLRPHLKGHAYFPADASSRKSGRFPIHLFITHANAEAAEDTAVVLHRKAHPGEAHTGSDVLDHLHIGSAGNEKLCQDLSGTGDWRRLGFNLLNQAGSRELTAISQYMAQHYEFEDQDFGKLASRLKEIAIQEMKHAEKLAERILYLKGEPTSKPDGVAKKGQKIQEMLATDIGLETQAIKMYNDASVICAAKKDQVSKEVFEELLKEEEDHLNRFENIKNHVDKIGPAYLATLTGKSALRKIPAMNSEFKTRGLPHLEGAP